MYDLEQDIEAEARKLDAKIKKLQEEKVKLRERMESEKQRAELARKVGMFVLKDYEKNPHEYTNIINTLSEILISDFDRQFFGLEPLAEDDPKRPRRRGRRKKESEDELNDKGTASLLSDTASRLANGGYLSDDE